MERVLLSSDSMSTNRPTISIKGRRGMRLAMSWRAAASSPAAPSPRLASPPSRSLRARGRPDGCYRLFDVAGIPVRFHWTALVMFASLVAAAGVCGAGLAVFACGVFTMMLAHELGHAFLARRLGYEVLDIRLFLLLGQCRHHKTYSDYEDAVIAWGGVGAQLLLLLPAIGTLTLLGNTRYGPINVLLIVFSYFNAVMMVCNLVPAQGMDGAKAWRLPLMLARAKWTMRQLRRSKVLF
jgi:Zn-dependent protease